MLTNQYFVPLEDFKEKNFLAARSCCCESNLLDNTNFQMTALALVTAHAPAISKSIGDNKFALLLLLVVFVVVAVAPP